MAVRILQIIAFPYVSIAMQKLKHIIHVIQKEESFLKQS